MAIFNALLKWYQCINWTENGAHGGDIDLSELMVTETMNNMFDDVTDEQRAAGMTDYRKIFFRNENADLYANVKLWISQNTLAENDEIDIRLGGTKSQLSTDIPLSGTATLTYGSHHVPTSVDLRQEICSGERICVTDDPSNYIEVDFVTATEIVLKANWTLDTHESVSISVKRADINVFTHPITKGAGLVLGSLAENAYIGIWVRRTVDPAGPGYTSNTFTFVTNND